MKRIGKYVVCALALALVCAVGAFAAGCGDKASGLTIVVQYEDGTPVDGTATGMTAQVCFADKDGVPGTCLSETPAVGKDGKATFPDSIFDELETAHAESGDECTQYHVQLNHLPEGYTYDETETYVSAAGTLTIVLKKTA